MHVILYTKSDILHALIDAVYRSTILILSYICSHFKVKLEVDIQMLSGKNCYSHNDPHMKSFDGL